MSNYLLFVKHLENVRLKYTATINTKGGHVEKTCGHPSEYTIHPSDAVQFMLPFLSLRPFNEMGCGRKKVAGLRGLIIVDVFCLYLLIPPLLTLFFSSVADDYVYAYYDESIFLFCWILFL